MKQSTPSAEPAGNQSPELPVGEILRRTRLHYAQSLEDIERVLHIKASQIDAIERGHFDRLPGRVYVFGFVRSYSEYLGLDGEKMVALLKSQFTTQTPKPEIHFPVAASESRIPGFKLIVLSCALALAVIIGWWSMQNHDRSLVDNIPPVPQSLADKGKPSETLNPAGPPVPANLGDKPPETAASQPQRSGVILKIIRNSWVEIKDQNGKPIVSRVLKEGDKYFVPDSPGMTMSLGNSGGVEIEIDGQSLGMLGAKGEVMRNIPLTAESLTARTKKTTTKPVAKTPQ